MQGSIGVHPYGKDGPYDVMFFPSTKDGAVPKYRVQDLSGLNVFLGSVNIKLTADQLEKLEGDGIAIQNLDVSDDVSKRYGLI